jgi:cell division protein FtsL
MKEVNTSADTEKAEKKEEKKKKKSPLSKILGGDILTENFVIKQSKLIILIVFLILVSISNYYDCAKKMTEIQDLNTQLKNLKYENLVLSTELTTNSRQSQIEELLKQKGIPLEGSKSPVFEIHK